MSGRRNIWFRFYNEALDDPKVQRLSPHLFKAWVNLLCIASANGGKIPSVDDVAFRLRCSPQDARQYVDDLIMAGLIDIGADGAREPHNWAARQFASDTSTDRVKKHRENKGTERNVSCNVTGNVSETAQTRAEQSRPESESTPLPPTPATKGRVLKNGFEGRGAGRGRSGEVRELTRLRAEGMGLPVDEIMAEAQEGAPDNLDAYFQAICRRRLRTVLPGIDDDLLRAAFQRNPRAYTQVMGLLMMVPTDAH